MPPMAIEESQMNGEQIIRCAHVEVEQAARQKLVKPGPKIDSQGNLLFWARAVDKNKTPNSLGLMFQWNSPSDVVTTRLQHNNAALFWMHDSSRIPLGMIIGAEVTSKEVWLQGLIPNDQDDPENQKIRQAVQDGLLQGVSIGFFLLEAEDIIDPQTEVVTAIGVKSFHIAEMSLVGLGAHESATIAQGPKSRSRKFNRQLLELEDRMSDVKWKQSECTGEMIRMEAVLPTNKWNVLSVDTEEDYLMEIIETGQAKFLHHDSEGNPTWEQCGKAMAILLGARGGIQDMNAEEQALAFAHLSSHYTVLGLTEDCPELRQYEQKELQDLHEAGKIIIPGYKQETPLEPTVVTIPFDNGEEETVPGNADTEDEASGETEETAEVTPDESTEADGETQAENPVTEAVEDVSPVEAPESAGQTLSTEDYLAKLDQLSVDCREGLATLSLEEEAESVLDDVPIPQELLQGLREAVREFVKTDPAIKGLRQVAVQKELTRVKQEIAARKQR